MTYLANLKAASSIHHLAHLLGYKPSKLAYVLYKVAPEDKYTTFEVPKKSGGLRTISAPIPELKLLQRRLANVLYDCRAEIEAAAPTRRALSHAYRKGHSIVTNARQHRKRRFVLNVDLKDYFPSLNFGRVRGFFIKNNEFGLNEKIATLIAQIACHENSLPQGSPCSPVISDLMTHLLDVRLAQLSKSVSCTYSRYSDDLTFSTNKTVFPDALAHRDDEPGSDWQLGDQLLHVISKSGFSVKDQKTRLQGRARQQVVTGLTVNKKVNIRARYYREARQMCHSLFRKGAFTTRPPVPTAQPEGVGDPPSVIEPSIRQLEGIISHIHYVKNLADLREYKEKRSSPTATRTLYRDLLFYKHFIANDKPLIICEGRTDPVYLRAAITKLATSFPGLVSIEGGKPKTAVKFFNYTDTTQEVMSLGGGSGDLKFLIIDYMKRIHKFNNPGDMNPVIILVDNDLGAKDVFPTAANLGNCVISMKTKDDFYHLGHNLYLVKTPEKGKTGESYIEQLFDGPTIKTKVGGKVFNPTNEKVGPGEYGKVVFAEKVVKPAAAEIDFSGFAPLLDRLWAAIEHHHS
jgi:RNA-directed DNA polymerase